MEPLDLQVRMLGGFSIRLGGKEINDSDNRSRKVWLLMAYMIYCRNRSISQEELADLLWGEEERSSNPINALKTMFHRVRSLLNQLDSSAGHSLIVRQEGTYAWNQEVPFSLDTDDFEALCRKGASEEDEEARLETDLQALALYGGDFLPKLSAEPWVVPISAYFHNLYIRTVQEVLPLLEGRGRLEEAAELCRKSVVVEPYNELLYQHLMQDLLTLGRQQEVISVYEDMSQLLFDNFGIMPSDETRAIYREAMRTVNDKAVSIITLREQLREPEGSAGALFCDYDFFKVLYHAEARAVARSGDAVHICLLSVTGDQNQELPKRSLDRCMENLQELIRTSLRKGDIAARCSISQYILMLPQANYENSCRVCERIIRAFGRQYPHSPASLHYSVQPLEPNA